jgi:hypothetical protein
MAAPQGPPNRREGELPRVTYSQITANATSDTGTKRPAFETPPEMRAQLLAEGTFKDKDMDIDSAKEKVVAGGSAPWVPGKCIPQAPQAPKYMVCSPRIKEQKQYMRDNA